MKRFLKLLNEFINWRDYKRRIDSENNRLRIEIEYCQSLLIHAVDKDVDRAKVGEINAYVDFIVTSRQQRRSFTEKWETMNKK